jgi:hypothetical protein
VKARCSQFAANLHCAPHSPIANQVVVSIVEEPIYYQNSQSSSIANHGSSECFVELLPFFNQFFEVTAFIQCTPMLLVDIETPT